MKAQMKFQKIMCLVMVLVGALSAIYCFIYCTGALSNIGITVTRDSGEIVYKPGFEEPGKLYMDVQPFNNALLILSIVMIIAGVLLYITATNNRRNYYISNYVATGVVCLADLAISIYIMIQNAIFYGRFNALMKDPEVLEKYEQLAAADATMECVTSGWTFAIGFVVYIIVILACVGLVLNLLWKIKLMRGEKALLASSEAVSEVAQ